MKVVREWVAKAENDLKAAAYTLRLGDNCPTDTVCFHAQQCAEKYLKAVLVGKDLDVPKTHDIARVLALIPEGRRPTLTAEEQRRLTRYATVTRYPGDYEPIPLAEARRAVRLARRIRQEVRKLLPPEVLRRKKR